MRLRRGMEAAVPCGKRDLFEWKEQCSSQVQGIETAQVVVESEPGRLLDEFLVYLNHAKGWPLFAHCPRRAASDGQPHGPNRLDEPNATNEPAVSGLHRAADEVAARLRHVTLDQRAGVEVEAQRSRSRSANTSSDARREEVVNRGARAGWLRAGGVTRPSTISWRRRSWLAEAPAGTMSASG